MNTETQALQKIEPMPATPTVEAMITLAVERGASVDTIERLMAVRREVRAEQAKEAFDRALAEFQDECPVIPKNKSVPNRDGSVRYRYADLEQIKTTAGPCIKKHGFSYRFTTKTENARMITTCWITHIGGHSEPSEFAVPIENSGRMNQVQESGSSSTYAKRYALANGLGIITSDEDNDGADGKSATKGQKDATNLQPKSQTTQRQQQPNVLRDKSPTGTAKPPGSEPGARASSAPPAPPAELPTEAQRQKWIGMLKELGPTALAWLYEKEWLIGPSGNFTGDSIEALSVTRVPRTRREADAILAEIRARMPAGASQPPSTSAPPASGASQAKPAGKALGLNGPADEQPWFNAVVPVPYAGMKRDEYLKRPDTIGELYNLRHDDEQARRRLFGFAMSYQPAGWKNRQGKQMPPSQTDLKFRDDLDAFMEWFEANHPDEVND